MFTMATESSSLFIRSAIQLEILGMEQRNHLFRAQEMQRRVFVTIILSMPLSPLPSGPVGVYSVVSPQGLRFLPGR